MRDTTIHGIICWIVRHWLIPLFDAEILKGSKGKEKCSRMPDPWLSVNVDWIHWKRKASTLPSPSPLTMGCPNIFCLLGAQKWGRSQHLRYCRTNTLGSWGITFSKCLAQLQIHRGILLSAYDLELLKSSLITALIKNNNSASQWYWVSFGC